MIVYRIENEIGNGPYVNCPFSWIVTNHSDKNHPPLTKDNFHLYFHDYKEEYWTNMESSPLKNYIFGFDSLEKLNQWFCEKEIENLKKLNYNIQKYEIDYEFVLEGESKKQVMFLKEKAIKIN